MLFGNSNTLEGPHLWEKSLNKYNNTRGKFQVISDISGSEEIVNRVIEMNVCKHTDRHIGAR